jgi:hypothetical protein
MIAGKRYSAAVGPSDGEIKSESDEGKHAGGAMKLSLRQMKGLEYVEMRSVFSFIFHQIPSLA